MQASVHTFDPETGSGSALLDDGRRITFTGAVFGASGLRHLRPGQRVSVELQDPTDPATPMVARRIWIVGIGPGETIR